MKIAVKKLLIALEFAMEITPIIPYIGVVFSFMGSLSFNCCNFSFLMILKEMLIFMPLSNPVLQYVISYSLILYVQSSYFYLYV